MAKAKAGRAARRVPAKDLEQKSLPGAESPRNEVVHRAALHLMDKIHAVSDAKKDEKEARQSTIDAMTRERVLTYHYGKVHLMLKGQQKLHVHEDKEKKSKPKKAKKDKAAA